MRWYKHKQQVELDADKIELAFTNALKNALGNIQLGSLKETSTIKIDDSLINVKDKDTLVGSISGAEEVIEAENSGDKVSKLRELLDKASKG